MTSVKGLLNNLLYDESGQDLIEYALIAAFIVLTALAAMQTFGRTIIGNLYNTLTNDFNNAL